MLRVTQQNFCHGIRQNDPSIRIEQENGIGRRIENHAEARLAFMQAFRRILRVVTGISHTDEPSSFTHIS